MKTGSQIYTDDHRGYTGLNGEFYQHHAVKHSLGEYVDGDSHTNGIESVWALLKRSIYGTYHHISSKHMAKYVNEASYRLNDGAVENMLDERMSGVIKGGSGKRLTYESLIA